LCKVIEQLDQTKLLSCAQHRIDSLYLGDFAWLQLRIATDDGYIGVGGYLFSLFNDLLTLLVSILRDRAGVDDENVRVFLKIDFQVPFFFKLSTDCGSF